MKSDETWRAYSQRTLDGFIARVRRIGNDTAPPVLFILATALVTLAFSSSQDQDATNRFVGDDKCLSCHQAQKNYLRTAHHFTSQLPTKESIAGSFETGKNVLNTPQAELRYRMDRTRDGFLQTAVLGTPPDTISISKQFDLVIGSGRKGQTYLYWDKGDQLFQLPVSYWTEVNSWVLSPGYGDRQMDFSRPVVPRCLECHASYFEPMPDTANSYRKTGYVLGISCERCHGPGGRHVALNVAKTATPANQAIVNVAKLNRERQLDLCGLCHGGIGVAKAAPFSFVVGNTLEDYLHLTVPKPEDPVDVHGSQMALLERSKCFTESTMTCSTCHDVHVPQREVRNFSERCLGCHKVSSCPVHSKQNIEQHCVDCHMPNQTSNVIFSSRDGVRISPKVRSHWIKVYRTATTR